jgi:hypothetical protein
MYEDFQTIVQLEVAKGIEAVSQETRFATTGGAAIRRSLRRLAWAYENMWSRASLWVSRSRSEKQRGAISNVGCDEKAHYETRCGAAPLSRVQSLPTDDSA